MASLTLHYCKLLCTRSFTSSIPRVCTATRSHSQTRYLQLWPATHQEANSKEEDSKEGDERDFDRKRDAVLGDFSKYDLSSETVRLLKKAGVNHLFEVQYKTYKEVREGIDVFVQARTGTGKTLGFALPIIETVQAAGPMRTNIFPQPPQVLALAPTRELAIQIAKEFEKFSARTTKVSCFYGGVSMSGQASALYRGVDILVGTPGRILDHLMNGELNLSTTRHVILDEADRMLDMGFQRDIEDILAHAYTKENKPQTLLFSATLPPWVLNISRRYTNENMQQFDLITSAVKSAILVEHKNVLCSSYQYPAIVNHFVDKYCDKEGKALVFTQTKREAENLARHLKNADYITGDKSQNQREKTLEGFKRGWFNVLVATDVASRGLDIPNIDFVLQTSPPKDVDAYIHRSGRTGRAGSKGLSIVLYNKTEFRDILLVEKHAGIKFTNVEDDPKLENILDTNTGKYDNGFHDSASSNNHGGFNKRYTGDLHDRFVRRHTKDFEGEFGTNHKSSRDFRGEYNRRSSKPFDGKFSRTSARDFQGGFNSKGSNHVEKGFKQTPSYEFDGRFNHRSLNEVDRLSEDKEQPEASISDTLGDGDYHRGFNRRPSEKFQRGLYNRPSMNFDEFDGRFSRDSGESYRRQSRDSTDKFNRQPSNKFEGRFNHRRGRTFQVPSEDEERFSSEELDSDLETSKASRGRGNGRKSINLDLLDELD